MQLGSKTELNIAVQMVQWTKKHFATEQEFKEWYNANPDVEINRPPNITDNDLPLFKSTETSGGYYAFVREV